MAMTADLLIDMGNSTLKWAWLQAGQLSEQQRVAYITPLKAVFQQAWQTCSQPPHHVWVCNVAGEAKAQVLQAWVQQHWRCPITFLQTQSNACGVHNSYPHYAKLGVDRWLTLLAVHGRYATDEVCIVDCGTAVTLDVLDAQGQHRGGLITAGIDLMRQTLARHTAALPLESDNMTWPVLNNDTETALLAGTAYSVVGLIEYTLRYCAASTQLVMTGGGAQAVLPLLIQPHDYVPNLVLLGMQVMVEQCES